MSSQEILLKQIRKQLSEKESINDEIASVLEISYDAAHRRVSGKSKFSIDETIELAKHFGISLDNLFFSEQKVIIEKTIEVTNLQEMQQYFSDSATKIESLSQNSDSVLYYSAKDIPLFYFMDATIISKFKAFVWLNLLNTNASNTSFEKFVVEESFAVPMQKLKKAYEKLNVREIWNDSTINSSLQQIQYFYEADLLSFKSAVALFQDLKRILNNLKEKSNKKESNFSIYYNELVMLDNNLLFESNKKLTLFVPYTLLGYFITDNIESCQNVQKWFLQQFKNSKPLHQLGVKEQNIFFNKAIRKIDFYEQKLINQVDLMY
jgi:plasmid maintenance system antidote protein VapI